MKFTQIMKMHLNGGSTFSELHYDILADGMECGISRHRRTNGSPKYLLEHDFFKDAQGERFDMMATKGVGIQAWLESHAKIEQAGGSSNG